MSTRRNQLLVGTCACALVANAAGYLFNLYTIKHFDDALHGFTLFAITLFAARVLHRRVLVGQDDQVVLTTLAIALIGIGVGALWEVCEWAYDWFTPANSILGKDDTMRDLIVDAVGSVIAAVTHVALWRQPRAPSQTIKPRV